MSTNIEILKDIDDVRILANHSHPYASTSHNHDTRYHRLLLNNISDFNDALTQGDHNIGYTGASMPNAPYTGNVYGKLRVYVNDGGTHNNLNNWIWQYFEDTSGRLYMRYKVNGGAWQVWVNLRDAASVGGYTAAQLIAASNSALGGQVYKASHSGYGTGQSGATLVNVTGRGQVTSLLISVSEGASSGEGTIVALDITIDGNTKVTDYLRTARYGAGSASSSMQSPIWFKTSLVIAYRVSVPGPTSSCSSTVYYQLFT